jgi:hypothetical protein
MLVSSANKTVFTSSTFRGQLFTYNRNRRGPKIILVVHLVLLPCLKIHMLFGCCLYCQCVIIQQVEYDVISKT